MPAHPEIVEAHLRIVQSYYNSGRDQQAIQEAKKFLSTYPNDVKSQDVLDLVEASLEKSPTLGYEPVLKSIVDENPKSLVAAEALYRLGRKLLDDQKYQAAAETFERFSVDFTDHPSLLQAQFYLAEAYLGAGEFEKTIPAYQRFLKSVSKVDEVPFALFHLGNAYYHLKRYDEAAAEFSALLQEYPDSDFVKAATFNLALAHKGFGQPAKSEEAYRRYIELKPGAANTQNSLWAIFDLQKEQAKSREALDTLKAIEVNLSTSDAAAVAEVIFRRGELYLSMGEGEQTKAEWKRFLNFEPADNAFRLQALVKMGDLYEKESNWALAIQVYENLSGTASSEDVARAARARGEALKVRLTSEAAQAEAVPQAQKTGENPGSADSSQSPGKPPELP